MSKAKKLIEVAMPIKEISAESVRDKSIRNGHISTLHLWWARRPLPACRAVVFGSLVPDPEDPACPQAFKDAVAFLLKNVDPATDLMYRPYRDIPYTAIVDPMEDTLRHRLMMFIGKFSDTCQANMIAGNSTPPKDQLCDGSLIKWENKNKPAILNRARELIFVAYNAEKEPKKGFESLHREFQQLHSAVSDAENELYSLTNRHQSTPNVLRLEKKLHEAIDAFQNRMPSVFDPFAGGGAIPMEAARLGCRSYGNDINPVAHIIERGSAEFPQKYGKPITFSVDEFYRMYGECGLKMLKKHNLEMRDREVDIPNRLAWDVEFYAKQILDLTEAEVGYLYPKDNQGRKPAAYYWARTARCSNPSCRAEIPLLKSFTIVKTNRKKFYIEPQLSEEGISFLLKKGLNTDIGYLKPRECTLTCPYCGTITSTNELKKQFIDKKTGEKLLVIINEGENGKEYKIPTESDKIVESRDLEDISLFSSKMQVKNNRNFNTPGWGIDDLGEIYSTRQKVTLGAIIKSFKEITSSFETNDYSKAVVSILALWIDRVAVLNTSFGVWNNQRETIEKIMGRQAIPMTFDYPESNPFCSSSGSALNQLDWIVNFLYEESRSSFNAFFSNSSSGDRLQFDLKSITSVVTDPPYYDAIAYADLSDFFYAWLKLTLQPTYPLLFATPQTPKMEECTALKHHHSDDENKAKHHFESKLTEIFSAIQEQTSDIVSIMFAHQSTEAWTTLCNSILDAKMNITGSWPMDTERSTGLKTGMAYLESSVTVACRPSERNGVEEFKEVEKAIKEKVVNEVEKLYELGFRGADLLTACFGQAVSEFGKYKVVEKANGDRVTVAELLDMARQTAYDTLLKGVKADELTRFYLGWLQMNGMGEADHDDVTQFTRVGVNVEIHDVIQEGLLIQNGNKNHLANAEEHLKQSVVPGTLASHPLIDQVHRAILLNRAQHIESLLKLIHDCAPSSDAQFWRVLAALKESLPASCPDLKDVQELLRTAEYLRTESKKDRSQQPTLFDNME